MRYALLINIDTTTPRPEGAELEAILRSHTRFEADLGGKLVHTARLRPHPEASRVALDRGHPLVTHGPFAETKEVLGGFYIVECDSKDEAIEWGKRLLLREDRTVEVWPVWER